jgi:malate dehydrogenase (oxaloacetate-decarboxylating)(NADP+)
MCIPIGKLALYCAIGGIAPHRVLPIQLDVGTNNETLLEDPNYVGLRQPRVLGEAYFKFLDEFMEAVTQRWPRVAIQFEDFETTKAIPLLERYRSKYLCFNDDIQGSGAVILSSILSATRQIDLDHFDKSNLTNHRILCLGAGAGGLGICTQLLAAMVAQGLTKEDAKNHFVICSSRGALGKPDGKHGDPHHHITCKLSTSVNKSQWYHSEISDGTTVEEVIETFKPTVLLGLTGKANSFTERILQRVTEHCQRPIILPMSSPASNCECTPEQAYSWTQGRAIVATGASFDPVTLPTEHKEGGRNHSITLHPSQCNNTFIFPGLGLACSIGGIKRLPDELFLAAAHACAQTVSNQEILRGQCFPDVNRVREVSHAVACGVLTEALKLKLVTKFTADDFADEGLQSYVDRKMYFPDYAPLC